MMMASMANPLAIGSSPASGGTSAAVANTVVDTHAKWLMTHEQIQNSPSRRDGIPAEQELSLRQKAAHLIQDMGQRLRVSQLCINTAIVYMHRFYMYHSFQIFHRNGIAAASLFLSAKVEEQPRKVESIIQTLFASQSQRYPEVTSTAFQEQAQDLVFNENILLQTLGFDVAIEHPHVHIVNACNLVKACKDLVNTSYFLASNSLHLTTMCIQYRPTVVACFCIYLACKWSRWEIPESKEGRDWFYYVDRTVTMEMLEQLTNEYLVIYDNSPSRLKKQLNNCKGLGLTSKSPAQPSSSASRPHPPQSLPGTSQIPRQPHHQLLQQQHSSSSSSSHNQRSTVHHNASKVPPPIHGQLAVSGQPSQATGLLSTSASSLRHPHQQRTDHHRPTPSSNHAEPQFTAPHRVSVTAGAVLPPAPSSQQMQAYGLHPSVGNSNNKSQQQYTHAMQQQHQQNHQKQRGLKELPTKYMDSKIPINTSTGVMPGQIATLSSSTSSCGSSGSKKNHYQHQTTQPSPSVQSQCTNNKYDMYKAQLQPTSGQSSSHTSNKTANYTTQQPPNYSQTMAGRNNDNVGSHHHTQQQSSSVYAHHQQQQQQQQQHQHPHNLHQRPNNHHSQPTNAYIMNSESQYGRLQPTSNTNTGATPAPNDDLLAIMLDTPEGGKPAKVPSIFSPDYMSGPKTPKKDKTKRDSDLNANAAYRGNSFAAGVGPDCNKQQYRQSSSTSTTSSSKHHRGADLASGQMVSLPPPNTYVMPHQMQQIVKSEPPSAMSAEYNKSSKRSHTSDDSFNTSTTPSMHHGTSTSNFNDYHRDAKFRKLESTINTSVTAEQASAYGSSMFSGLLKSNSSFNGAGIETNPDMVSSLLKESLCSNNSNSKYTNNLLVGHANAEETSVSDESTVNLSTISGSNDALKMPINNLMDMKPTLDILGTDMPVTIKSATSTKSQLMPTTATISADAAVIVTTGSANDSSDHEHMYKSEKKKKKKEKSKHKERGDREERKKHKKDKERNRERIDTNDNHTNHHRTSNVPGCGSADSGAVHHNPIKIKIPKEKLHMSNAIDATAGGVASTLGLKITIPKDRISGGGVDGCSSTALINSSGGSNVGSGLKIKISKDVLLYNTHEASGSGGYDSTNNHRIHSSSSKKRDRDHGSTKSLSHYQEQSQHQQPQQGPVPSSANATKNMWVNH